MQQASTTKFHKMRDVVAGQYIVRLNDNIPHSEVPSLASQLTNLHGGVVEYIYQDVLKGFSVKQMSEQQAIALSRRSEVSSVEEGARVIITGQQPMPAENTVIKPLDRIDQRSSFDGNYTYPRTGSGVHVYVVDTGVWIRHSDFGGRAAAVWDFDPATSAGGYATGAANDNHGTLSASYIGSKNFGVAKNCQLYSVRVANYGGTGSVGTSSDFIAGMQHVLSDVNAYGHRPAVVNISLGFYTRQLPGQGPPISPSQISAVESAVSSVINSGITVVAGAGNDNVDAGTAFTPARMSSVLTVGGTYGIPGVEDQRATYPSGGSNFGSAVDIYAPSGGVLNGTAWFVRGDTTNSDINTDGNYGTSAAAPHAAGAAALYLEQYSFDPNNFWAQPAQVESQIKNNASFTSLPILYMGCEFIAPPASHPSDDPYFFVRQHYYDFLGRQPDSGGLNYWANELIMNPSQTRRIQVSRAFFESDEFKGTGYFIYRLNKLSYQVRPAFSPFFVDLRIMNTGATLEQEKASFSQIWIGRPQFQAQYGSLSNEAYVDTLNQHSGSVLTQSERDALVNGLYSDAETRATVITKIADNAAYFNNEFNNAYVLMQYFGYLRREPDQEGYDFWLFQLNVNHATYDQMVEAFIGTQNPEYRDRFYVSPFCSPTQPFEPPPDPDPCFGGWGCFIN
jgi:hypothetical protein